MEKYWNIEQNVLPIKQLASPLPKKTIKREELSFADTLPTADDVMKAMKNEAQDRDSIKTNEEKCLMIESGTMLMNELETIGNEERVSDDNTKNDSDIEKEMEQMMLMSYGSHNLEALPIAPKGTPPSMAITYQDDTPTKKERKIGQVVAVDLQAILSDYRKHFGVHSEKKNRENFPDGAEENVCSKESRSKTYENGSGLKTENGFPKLDSNCSTEQSKNNDNRIKTKEFENHIGFSKDSECVAELYKKISKEDFKKMKIIGQFNLGFIVFFLFLLFLFLLFSFEVIVIDVLFHFIF